MSTRLVDPGIRPDDLVSIGRSCDEGSRFRQHQDAPGIGAAASRFLPTCLRVNDGSVEESMPALLPRGLRAA